jgi:hypothetical protein
MLLQPASCLDAALLQTPVPAALPLVITLIASSINQSINQSTTRDSSKRGQPMKRSILKQPLLHPVDDYLLPMLLPHASNNEEALLQAPILAAMQASFHHRHAFCSPIIFCPCCCRSLRMTLSRQCCKELCGNTATLDHLYPSR